MGLPEQAPAQPDALTALVGLSLHGIEVARQAAAKAGDALASGSPELFQELERLEEELDQIDREMDEGVAQAVTRLSVEQARELLACLKFTIDLERIGDLIASFSGRARALGFPERGMSPPSTKTWSVTAAQHAVRRQREQGY